MSTKNRIPATFMTVDQFKRQIDASHMEVVFNENSGSLSVLVDDTDFYKCQQTIDQSKPMAFLLPSKVVVNGVEREGTIEDACLVNVSKSSPLKTKFAL